MNHMHHWKYWETPVYLSHIMVRYCTGCDTIQQRERKQGWVTLPFPFSQAVIQVGG